MCFLDNKKLELLDLDQSRRDSSMYEDTICHLIDHKAPICVGTHVATYILLRAL